jgi:hypothetical protein
MPDLKEALKTATTKVKFLDRDEVIAQGRRAFRMDIDQRNNPRKTDGERKLWDIGWTAERDAWLKAGNKMFPGRRD